MRTQTLLNFQGATLPVWVEGQGSPVALLHAGVADSSSWDDLVPLIVRDGYRAIRYDARNYGASTTEAVDYSPRDDLWAVLDAVGVQRVALIGNSRGGSTAIDAAVERPDRVVALVLIGTGLNGFDAVATPAETAAFDRMDDAFRNGRFLDAVEEKVRLWVDGIGQPPTRVRGHVRDHVREMLLPHAEVEELIAHLVPLDPPASVRLGSISAPTLIVTGEYDTLMIHQIESELANGIPGAKATKVPDAAHMVAMEHPAKVADLVLAHLALLGEWN